MGAAQEELMFLAQPECLPSMVLCEEMKETEAVVICGTRPVNRIEGYGRGFQWAGMHQERIHPTPPRGPQRNYENCVVCIDAIEGGTQGQDRAIQRELGK